MNVSHSREHSDPTYEAWKPPTSLLFHTNKDNSDPTYEAWKLTVHHSNAANLCIIPILPTRHGNALTSAVLLSKGLRFRSYLRGMETMFPFPSRIFQIENSDPTYEAWKLVYASPFFEEKVNHSDPTYEAWKPPHLSNAGNMLNPHSDPTYEAWKRATHNHLVVIACHSDPTYEAWKPRIKFFLD